MEGLAKWAISLGLVALCADGISGSACPMHLAAVHGSVPGTKCECHFALVTTGLE
jgi:hypothetical protein